MKAIIMAGGEGTRLKPVSGDVPKPMVPLCGRPVMEHTVRLLKKHGITDICCALKYRPQVITDYFGGGEKWGVNMQYRIEENALGTAGAVRNCEDFYEDEDFLVISGDAVCDLDLTDFIKEHEKRRPAASLVLYPHAEPLRYGLALCDKDACIRGFIEKPDWHRVVTNLVNTGIYILSPAAMSRVPENTVFDFGKDLFPKLLNEGERLFGYVSGGYWCDIGTPQSYYQCCLDVLNGLVDIEPSGGFERTPSEEITDPEDGERVDCRDRAQLMERVSAVFLDMGADFSDGIRLHGSDFELSVHPVSDAAAVRIKANAADTELAAELTQVTAEMIKRLENGLDV